MSESVRGIIVSHGALARALIEAVDCIVGSEHGLTAVSNEGCGSQLLEDRIAAALGPDPAVLFTDLAGGSCFMASAKSQRDRDDVRLVTGVNLPMLLEFVHHRQEDLDTIVRRLIDAGTKSVRPFPT